MREVQTIQIKVEINWVELIPKLTEMMREILQAQYDQDYDSNDKVLLSCGMIPKIHFERVLKWWLEQYRLTIQARRDKLGDGCRVELERETRLEAEKKMGEIYHTVIYEIHRKAGYSVIL